MERYALCSMGGPPLTNSKASERSSNLTATIGYSHQRKKDQDRCNRPANFFDLERLDILSETTRPGSPGLSIPSLPAWANQACILGEDLAKQPAAIKTKGVVGSNGSTTPAPPSRRNKTPKTDQGFNAHHRSVTRSRFTRFPSKV